MFELVASIRDNPASAAFGCASLIPLVVWAVAVVNWMIMGEMDFLFGVIAILCAVLLGFVVMMPSEPIHSPIAFVGIISLLIVFPIVRRQLDRRALVAIDVEQIEGAYAMLSLKPDNSSAMFKLAEKLYHRGLVGHAIGIGERALANMPQGMFPQENRAIQNWRHGAKGQTVFLPLPCFECGHRNGASSVYCETCGSACLAMYARGKWLGKTLAVRLVGSWVLAMIALVGLPVALSSIEDVPLLVAVCTLQVAIAGLVVWRAFIYKEVQS